MTMLVAQILRYIKTPVILGPPSEIYRLCNSSVQLLSLEQRWSRVEEGAPVALIVIPGFPRIDSYYSGRLGLQAHHKSACKRVVCGLSRCIE